ncbi:MAG: DUF1566 domain-containing protein [Betaproteobacteria bacterium]|nr:DUF1566 domain-containing protein [Betaproteobacteria bacterium]
MARVDRTAAPQRLILVDKTALPAGATVETATGKVSIPLVAVIDIASVTLNSAAFTNTGQFALAGNNLIIDPNLITQPPVGVQHTYVVTLNNSGGGTTVATVRVSRGSVRIDSVEIQINSPLTGFALSSNSVAYGGTAPTITAPTSASNGAISYSSSNTNVATINASTGVITLVGAGNVTFTATQAASGNYASSTAQVALTVTSDTTPDAFSFTAQSDVAISTLIESNTITVAGINAAATISVTNGEYRINGGAYTSTAGTVTNGQTVTVRHTSSASGSAATNTTLTIGGVSATFTSTTLPAGFITTTAAQTVVALTWSPNNNTVPGGTSDWTTANAYCSSNTINGQSGWRLPTRTELIGLRNSGKVTSTPPGWALLYTWSSTQHSAGIHSAVLLLNGIGIWTADMNFIFVSCVR